MGGLLEHIKVDVELRDPQNLQTIVYLARAFERHAAAVAHVPPPWGNRQPPRLALPVPPRAPTGAPALGGVAATPAVPTAPAGCPFRHLSLVEMAEQHRQLQRALCPWPCVSMPLLLGS